MAEDYVELNKRIEALAYLRGSSNKRKGEECNVCEKDQVQKEEEEEDVNSDDRNYSPKPNDFLNKPKRRRMRNYVEMESIIEALTKDVDQCKVEIATLTLQNNKYKEEIETLNESLKEKKAEVDKLEKEGQHNARKRIGNKIMINRLFKEKKELEKGVKKWKDCIIEHDVTGSCDLGNIILQAPRQEQDRNIIPNRFESGWGFGLDSTKNANSQEGLRISFINVNGLISKAINPDFKSLLESHDIIGFCETNITEKDSYWSEDYIDPDFKLLHKCRGNSASGGICVAFRTSLKTRIQKISTESVYSLWLKVRIDDDDGDNEDTRQNQNKTDGIAYIAVVYIPGRGSPYDKGDAFEELKVDVNKFYALSKNILLLGDFNAHVGVLDDLVDPGIDKRDTEAKSESEIMAAVRELNLPRTRLSKSEYQDNVRGLEFIQLCKSNELIILNGRCGPESAKCTTKKKDSIVDYVVCSGGLLHRVNKMSVGTFSNQLSDIHIPIEVSLSYKNANDNACPTSTTVAPQANGGSGDKEKLTYYDEGTRLRTGQDT